MDTAIMILVYSYDDITKPCKVLNDELRLVYTIQKVVTRSEVDHRTSKQVLIVSLLCVVSKA